MSTAHLNDTDHSVRIAAVRYLNTAPLIEGLQSLRSIGVTTAAPSHIADLVRAGEADLGLVSIIDAVRDGNGASVSKSGPASGRLAIVPVGMIGSDGPTLTVRIFSSVPIDRIRTLHADTDSHTSIALARVLLRRITGRDVETIDFDARERVSVGATRSSAGITAESGEWPTSLLLIGDKVVTDSPPAVRYPYQLDLGEAWKAWTGLPFVYAAWMCREEDANSERVRFAASVLDRQLRHNLTRLDWIVAHRAGEHRWPTDLARVYLGSLLRFRVGPREREGAARFFDEAAKAGIITPREPLWINTDTLDRVGPSVAAARPLARTVNA